MSNEKTATSPSGLGPIGRRSLGRHRLGRGDSALILLALFFERHIIEGLTQGTVKG